MSGYYNQFTDDVKTGDVILFSGDLLTGQMLKFFTNSKWNHGGIAIRIDDDKVVKEGGSLCIFEINTDQKIDVITGNSSVGIGVFSFDSVMKIYHTFYIRRLDERYRDIFISNFMDFYKNSSSLKFNKKIKKFMGGWAGIALDTDTEEDGVFCTEMMAMCYEFCFGEHISSILSIPFLERQICTPSHYISTSSPLSIYFTNDDVIRRPNKVSKLSTLTLILVMTLIGVSIIILSIIILNKIIEWKNKD